ncbi:hypothetical protein [Dactylosporangium sp. NPDC048998]|uniref:hypothetical protein n=1 Tax=Dactylosporangium sp. NPDC048998 TaxID=3363976 RepID=UPI00371C1470
MDLEDVGCRAKYMIRDRDSKFPASLDTVLKDAGVEVVLSGIRMPRMNAIMERWVQRSVSKVKHNGCSHSDRLAGDQALPSKGLQIINSQSLSVL